MRMNRTVLLGLGISALAAAAHGLTIQRNFLGGAVPGNAAGAGTLPSIFNAAADLWEAAILDSHTVTLDYRWGVRSGGTLASHSLGTQGGNPNRELSGTITFDNDGSSVFFLDDSPFNNSEYTSYTETNGNLGGGMMNVGRVHSGATGLAAGRWDLFSVALHEIGHALGMSAANNSFNGELASNGGNFIIVDSPLPHTGAILNTVSGAHLNISSALLFPSIGSGSRRLISGADVLANAEISKFTNVNLNPQVVPEPATIVVTTVGFLALARRRQKV